MQWSQILAQNRDFCRPHLHSTPPLGEFPSKYCHTVWYRKIRMAWLSDGEKFLKICFFVLSEFTNVTDTQTDTQGDTDTAWRHRPRLCIASRGNKTIVEPRVAAASGRANIYVYVVYWKIGRNPKIGQVWRPVAPQPYTSYKKVERT